MTLTLAEAAVAVLTAPEPAEKCRLSRLHAEAWASGAITEVGTCRPPDRPARPEKPLLLPPRAMPKRSTGPRGRIALLHALAHIELNAVDLAWDIVARFTDHALPRAFYDDWVRVARDEAQHFDLLEQALRARGAAYGDLPAHDGLWQAAEQTADSLEARLAIVPLTHEARGLDTTPGSLERLRGNGDSRDIVAALEVIYRDEITHVSAGVRWFTWLAERKGCAPDRLYHTLIRARYKGSLKPPFNDDARAAAGMPRVWYEPLGRSR